MPIYYTDKPIEPPEGGWQVGPGITECESCGESYRYWLSEDGETNNPKNALECRPALSGDPARCKHADKP